MFADVLSLCTFFHIGLSEDGGIFGDLRIDCEALFESDQPLEYMVDGDRYRVPGPLRLRVGPKLRFIRPSLPMPLALPASA